MGSLGIQSVCQTMALGRIGIDFCLFHSLARVCLAHPSKNRRVTW